MSENIKIHGILLDAKTGTAKVKDLEDSLRAYYHALDCDTIDIVSRTVKGLPVNIVLDDEGLLRPDPIVTCLCDGEAQYVGSMFVTGPCNEEGELTSLSREDTRKVLSAIVSPLTSEIEDARPLTLARNVLVVDDWR